MNTALQQMNMTVLNSGTKGYNDGGCSSTGGSYVQPLTTGCVQFYPSTLPWNVNPSYYQYIYTNVAPTQCSGDVHVFPCAKCGECKCGKAKLAKGQK